VRATERLQFKNCPDKQKFVASDAYDAPDHSASKGKLGHSDQMSCMEKNMRNAIALEMDDPCCQLAERCSVHYFTMSCTRVQYLAPDSMVIHGTTFLPLPLPLQRTGCMAICSYSC
jgi:hypothetical protein